MTVGRTNARITRDIVTNEEFSMFIVNLSRPNVTMSEPLIEWP